MSVVLASSAGNVLVWIVWFAAAIACVGSGIAVVSFSNPFYSALALIGNLASLAVLYLLLSAEFVAAAQVLVYAGAVMVMFLFVIAYLGGRADAPWAGGPNVNRRGRRRGSGSNPRRGACRDGAEGGRIALARGVDHGQLRLARGDRPAVPDGSPARVRDHVRRASDRRGRRRRPRRPRAAAPAEVAESAPPGPPPAREESPVEITAAR